MTMTRSELENLIIQSFPKAIIDIQDLAGDDNHYSISIKSELFRNKTKLEQHQLVYSALQEKMGIF